MGGENPVGAAFHGLASPLRALFVWRMLAAPRAGQNGGSRAFRREQPCSTAASSRSATAVRSPASGRSSATARTRPPVAPICVNGTAAALARSATAASILCRHHVARLILAEPEGVRRESSRGASSTAPMPEAIAISASATRRPPSETSCTAVTRPSPISARTKSPLRALRGKIDRRRRALLAAANLAQIERLAEPAVRVADQKDRLALGLERERHRRREIVEQADAADGRRRQDRAAVGLVVERDVAGHDREIERRAASPMPRTQPTNCPMISGRSGLPKLRLSVSASGRPPTARDIAPGLRHRLLAALVRIGLAIARRDVGGERQRLRPVVDAHHGGIAARPLHGVAADDVIVLLPHPALGAEVGRGDQLFERIGDASSAA